MVVPEEINDIIHIPAYKYEDIEPGYRPKDATGFLPVFIGPNSTIKPEIVIKKISTNAPSSQLAQHQCRIEGGHLITAEEYMAAYFWLQGWVMKHKIANS